MKSIIYLCVLGLFISCKGKITNIKITPAENDKNYKCFISNEEIFDYKKRDTIFIYHPVSFRINNKTGRDLRMLNLRDNFHAGIFSPFIYKEKYYDEANGKIKILSGGIAEFTMFVHLPVPANLIEKNFLNELLKSCHDGRCDSVSLNKISPKLQSVIDSLIIKKSISTHLYEGDNFYGGVLSIYCVNRRESATFRMDSITNLKDGFKYNCD
ncbi:hypothetical protein [Flavobacterium reichenbachii]|uniref:Lipoprotein n=1 Tax=Flavobacterium reichenbachii TaxID=362418 RepID=A0A085ZGC2_9FLAO|nr:hypothetical protein [Flavobacterium reichenbachii]KFF03486.1 hypothetical protein IW19_21640 [Flavobacterium reichenbachii]OXB15691.1 hypothetical protein B0A68_09890 [Flavobacterium reichenbachii]